MNVFSKNYLYIYLFVYLELPLLMLCFRTYDSDNKKDNQSNGRTFLG